MTEVHRGYLIDRNRILETSQAGIGCSGQKGHLCIVRLLARLIRMGKPREQREVTSVLLEDFQVFCEFIVSPWSPWEKGFRKKSERATDEHHAFGLLGRLTSDRWVHRFQER